MDIANAKQEDPNVLPIAQNELASTAYCTGRGQHDTHATTLNDGRANPHKSAGTPYATITGEGIAAMVENPPSVSKDKAQWFIPSTYAQSDGRNHDQQLQHGAFHWLTLDIDKNSLCLDDVKATLEAVTGACSHLIYSTRSATLDRLKWRALVPLTLPLSGSDYSDTQSAFFDLLERASDGALIPDRKLKHTGQLIYLPNKGDHYQSHIERTAKLDLTGHKITAHRDHLRAEWMQAEAEVLAAREAKAAQRAATAQPHEVSPIDHYNAAHSIADMLEHHGYTRAGHGKDYRSPMQTSGSYATRDMGEYWISLSGSDDAAEIGVVTKKGHRCGDAFALFLHFEHGGDYTSAVRTYSEEAGLQGQAHDNVHPFSEGFMRKMNNNAEQTVGGNKPGGEPAPANNNALQWPDPDMCVIKPERSPAPVMTDEDFATTFGDWAGWLKSAAEVKSAHVDYVALALLSAASAAIGNTRWAVPWDGWKEPPILWGMLVGDPSAGKSPALDAVLDPIKEIDAGLSRDFQKERTEWSDKDEVAKLVLSQWKSDVKSALADDGAPPEKPDTANAGTQPVRNRIRITDVTTEKVAELVQATWRGLLLSRDELSGWLGSMDRYSGGGDRPFWLEAFGGRSYTIDRKNSPDPIIIEHLSVAVLGGTQPDKLDALLIHSGDDGLLARFLTVFPDPVDLKRPTVTLDATMPERAFKWRYLAL